MIEMRTGCDCMVACLAMLMDWTYEETSKYFPPKAVEETGYRFEWLMPYLRADHIWLTWFDCKDISPDWSKPTIIDVPSLTAPEKGDHIIFWDGKEVFDPARALKYTEFPETIICAYQLTKDQNS